jgi:Raf kinase inhibitor-like YbhB/YbcL family protein
MADIQMRSTAFNDHDIIPDRLSGTGGNTSPPLEWSGVPDAAEELVLLLEDPDAGPTPFLHWLVTGIDTSSTGVDEGQVPSGGREWPNGMGRTGYAGPQPPKGDNAHRYFFRLYAVDQPLDLPEQPEAPDVHRTLAGRELASGVLVGMFGR